MAFRAAYLIVVVCSITALGCTSQPLSPSSVSDNSGIAATGPGAGARAVTAVRAAAGGRAGSTGVVYVTSQGLYYDTFVARDPLPMKGKFQLLENGATEFGPGDPGYLGGRWWEDRNGNGMQDDGDHFFLCPLLPPGRVMP